MPSLLVTAIVSVGLPMLALAAEEFVSQYWIEERATLARAAGPHAERVHTLLYEVTAGVPRIVGISAIFSGFLASIALTVDRSWLESNSTLIEQHAAGEPYWPFVLILACAQLVAGILVARKIFSDELLARANGVRRFRADRWNTQIHTELRTAKAVKTRFWLNAIAIFTMFLPLVIVFGEV